MTFNIDLVFDFSLFPLKPGSLFDINTNNPAANAAAQKARDVIQEAANTWQMFIKDDFATVPKDTQVTVTNPNTGGDKDFALTSDVNDIRIFVGSRDLSNTEFADTRQGDLRSGSSFFLPGVDYDYLKARRRGLNAEPFAASIAFHDSNAPTNLFFASTKSQTQDYVIGSGAVSNQNPL